MTKHDYKVLNPIGYIHPGEILVEYLDSNCWNQRNLARRTGLTPKTISEICNGKAPITTNTSLALEKAFRRPAHFWLNLQHQYDESRARQKFHEKSKDWLSWSQKFPINELKKLSLLPASEDRLSDLDALLSFLGVSSPEAWDNVWDASQIAFRQTRTFKSSFQSIYAWVRATEHYSEQIETSVYDETDALKAIDALKICASRRVDKSIEDAQSICASVGIALVLVPLFSNTGISGCARWLSSEKALIGLSDRYKTDDQFWFTFFHEFAHLVLHRRTHNFVLDNAVEYLSDKIVDPTIQKLEDEANRFAADTLIPPEELASFLSKAEFTNTSIKGFSEQIGVTPGIVVGRLQHEELLKPHQGNTLKQKIKFDIS